MTKNVSIFLLVGLLCLSFTANTEILWEDNFDDYESGMWLGESPYWETDYVYPVGFTVELQKENDMWIGGNYTGIFKASGGAFDSDMKVSVNEVCHSPGSNYGGSFGVLTRLSEDGSCYGAFMDVYKEYYSDPQYRILIGYFESNDIWLNTLTLINIPDCVETISILATGQDPVHISAWFDGYNLTYDDYSHNYSGGYGGIYSEGSMQWYVYLDDFTEEEVQSSITPASIGKIKTLFNE
jgi:hypothetical protein